MGSLVSLVVDEVPVPGSVGGCAPGVVDAGVVGGGALTLLVVGVDDRVGSSSCNNSNSYNNSSNSGNCSNNSISNGYSGNSNGSSSSNSNNRSNSSSSSNNSNSYSSNFRCGCVGVGEVRAAVVDVGSAEASGGQVGSWVAGDVPRSVGGCGVVWPGVVWAWMVCHVATLLRALLAGTLTWVEPCRRRRRRRRRWIARNRWCQGLRLMSRCSLSGVRRCVAWGHWPQHNPQLAGSRLRSRALFRMRRDGRRRAGRRQLVRAGPGALRGGNEQDDLVDAERAKVDEFLLNATSLDTAVRVPNSESDNCLFVALFQAQARNRPPPTAAECTELRESLADRAEATRAQGEALLGGREKLDAYIAGLRGTAWGDHFAIHLAANVWQENILVVQGGENPVVRIRATALKTKAKARTRIIARVGNHFDAVYADSEAIASLTAGAPFSLLSAATTHVHPLVAITADSPASCVLDSPEPGHYCPLPHCSSSKIHRSVELTHRNMQRHLQAHAQHGDILPAADLRRLRYMQCVRCGDVITKNAQGGTCFACRSATAPSVVPKPRDRTQMEIEDDSLLPSAQDIALSRSRVMEFIPDYMLRATTVATRVALNDIAADNTDLAAWNRFGMLWKTLLRTRRSGKTKKKRMREKRIEDLERWEKGELSALWRDAQAQVPGRRTEQEDPTFEDRERACVAEARKGRSAAAFSRLSSKGLAPDSEATLQALRAKHPAPQSPTTLDSNLVNSVSPVDLTPAQVLALVKRMPRGTAAGPSGLRADHLKQMLTESDVDILPALTHVINAIRAANVPDEVTPFLAGARLMALPKGDNDVRPIAVGETLRRLAAKSFAAEVKKQAKDVLLPGKQVGVGVEGGIEAATATVWDYTHRHSGHDKVVLKIDYSNAFNTVCRSAMLNQTRKHLPQLSRFVEWCYVDPSSLVYGETVVDSQTGAQQGDPLGPLLFSLVVKDLTEKVRDLPGVDLAVWYLDDGTLMGSPQGVAAAFKVLQEESLSLGLSVNSKKCELIPLGLYQPDSFLNEAGFTVSDLTVIRDGFSFLGAPIGTNEFCDKFMEKKLHEFALNLRLLGKLGDAQVALSLLRHCEGFCKAVFYMRAVRHQGEHLWLKKYDKEVDRVLAQILSSPGTDPDILLPDAARLQAALPVRMGGLGVRRSYDHWTAAAMGAASGTYALCKHLDKHYRWDAAGWSHTATRYNELVDADARVDTEELPQQILKQRDLSASIIVRQVANLRDEGDVQDRARLNSLLLPLAGAWITALPLPENVINPEEFRAVVRLRLGLVVHRDKSRCEQCGQPMDEFGVHALNCKHGGCTIRRHNRVRDLVGMLGSKAGLAPALEPKHIVLGGTKPADIFFSIGIGDGRPRAVDCTIWNPLAASHVQEAARAVGHAAVKAQSKKRGKHGDACRKAHISFSAFAAEVFGGLGPEAATLWRHLNKMAAERADGDKVLASVKWNERLAVGLQREVGATLLKRGALCFSLGNSREALPEKLVPLSKDYYAPPDTPDDRFPSYVDDHLYRLAENDCEIVEEPAAPDPPYDVDEATVAMEVWLQRQAGKETTHQSSLEVTHAPCDDPAAAFQAQCACDPPPALATQLSALGCSVPGDFRYTVGDCCFDAVAYQCERDAGSLRLSAIAQVVQDEDLAARAEPNVAVWASRMRIAGSPRPDTWADMVTVNSLARVLHSVVVVFVLVNKGHFQSENPTSDKIVVFSTGKVAPQAHGIAQSLPEAASYYTWSKLGPQPSSS